MRQVFAILAGALLLAACASGDKTRPVPPAPDVPEAGSLPAQDLADGECALFLWTQGSPRRFVYFSKAGSQTAETCCLKPSRPWRWCVRAGPCSASS